MRPTTKDLAKAAGVSRATVDRVLNGRPGVHAKTVQAVQAAVRRLGFERNLSAANLAKRRVYRFAFLLPRDGGEFLAELDAQIREHGRLLRPDCIEITARRGLERDPHQVVATLATLTRDEVDGVAIMASESPQVRDATLRLIERGIHVVQFISGQHGARPFDFVGIDNFAAGATAARLLGGFCRQETGQVMVIAESMNSLDSAERRLGFDQVLGRRFPGLSALPTLETHGNAARADAIIAAACRNFHDIVGIYMMSSEAAMPLDAILRHGAAAARTIVAHERTARTVELLKDDVIDALIVQNPGHVVRSAVRLLKGRCDGRAPLASQEDIRIEILLKENLGAFARAGVDPAVAVARIPLT